MGGLQKDLFLSLEARVMLTRNLWTNVGLCNGALGTVHKIIYANNEGPPNFPIAILIQFDNYTGPSFSSSVPRLVPIPPSCDTSESLGSDYERTQFPLKLAWAITIHKSQGLTLDNISVDLGRSESSQGLTYVALSRVRSLESLVVEPMSFQRLTSIGKSKNFTNRLLEEERLRQMSTLL